MNNLDHSEDKIQSDCYLWLFNNHPLIRGLCFHIPNGGYRGAREANKFRAMGVVAGVPDLFLSIPSEPYHGLYIEMKTPTGTLSHEQKEMHAKLTKAGYLVIVCRSLEDFQLAVKTYLRNTVYSIV